MYGKEPFFEYQKDWVTVWVGTLGPTGLSDYLEEPGGAGDDEPFSDFAADLGEWYDHDFVWAEAVENAVPCRVLCEINEIELPRLVAEIEKRYPGSANAILILWNARLIDGGQRYFAAGEMACIGCWEHESPLSDPDY